jgi:hypothetical protein
MQNSISNPLAKTFSGPCGTVWTREFVPKKVNEKERFELLTPP